MNYLENTIYVQPQYLSWPEAASLPFFLQNTFEFKYVIIKNIPMIFAYYKLENSVSVSLKKHLSIIEKKAGIPVVLILDKATYRERDFLIKNKIPFIVKNRQIFLPFLGYVLQENFAAEKEKAIAAKLTPTAQKLLFYIIYEQIKGLCASSGFIASQIGKTINIQPMSISRATTLLQDLQLVDIEIKGHSKVLFPKTSNEELLDMANPYIIEPTKKKMDILITKNTDYRPIISGETALAEYTNLNPPPRICWGLIKSKKSPGIFNLNIQDSDYTSEFELWTYDPTTINGNKEIADPLSLYAAFKNNNDERIQNAITEMLHNLWKGRYIHA